MRQKAGVRRSSLLTDVLKQAKIWYNDPMATGKTLQEILAELSPKDGPNVEAVTKKKGNVGMQLVEVSKDNLSTVDELVDEIRTMYDKGQTREANRLMAIAKKLLYNNAKYQVVVGRVLSDLKQ